MRLETGIVFGRKYRERNTGFEGVANAVYFFEFGCTRVNLIGEAKEGEIKEHVFDEQSLTEVPSGEAVRSHARAGGDRPGPTGTRGVR